MIKQSMLRFDSQLIDCIESGSNEVAKSLLKRKLPDIKDVLGLLLHRAALCDNAVITQHLIELGCNTDILDYDSKTPLMIAVEEDSVATVKVLLEANANVDIANADGKTAVQLIFSSRMDFSEDILVLFLRRLQRDSIDLEELLEKLIDVGCSMCHAAFLRDTEVMKGLLNRGLDINARGYRGGSALHIAVELGDVDSTKWLLDNKADVNAVNDDNECPLYFAARQGKVDLVRLLLVNGANPNVANASQDYTPLFCCFAYSFGEADQKKFDECIELLLQYEAIPRNSSVDSNTLFDYALLVKSNDRINRLIAHLAKLDRLGNPVYKSVMRYNVEAHFVRLQSKLDKAYKLCWELLGISVDWNLTVLDLLVESDDKLRIRVRDRMLVAKINYVNGKLGKIYTFYFEPLMKRVGDAVAVAMLEDKAIPILCQLLHGNYNQCYNFARKIVGYLSADDLERLCRV